MKLGYLGPHGTFTEHSAYMYANEKPLIEFLPFTTIFDTLKAVENGEIEEAIVPFENSIEGTVNTTLDTMIFDVNLYIKAEVVIPIIQNLMVKKEYKNQEIKKILSHPQGLAQCHEFLRQNYPLTKVETVSSTAEAAKIISHSDENWAAIGASFAASVYDLKILHPSIQDKNHNKTRFLVLSKELTKPGEKNQKTSIVFSTENRPGELYRILDILSIWNLNMTKIESRPMKDQLGTYHFFIDLESENEKDMEDALTMIQRKTSFFKRLGSYPADPKFHDYI